MVRATHERTVRFRPGQQVDGTRQALLAAGGSGQRARGAILHPTDYSAPSRQAFELACRIARSRNRRLLVMHVAEPVWRPSLGMAAQPPLPRGYRAAWESRLRLVRPHDPAVLVEHRLEEGDVVAAILRVAREAQSDLIVMAGRERTGLGRLLTGSITEAVERGAPCPVARLHVWRPGDGGQLAGGDCRASEGAPPRAILHPTDFSRPARYGFEVARSLARVSGSELIVAHVADIRDLHRKTGYRDEMEATLRRVVASDPTTRARWVLLAGDPAAEIRRMAREGLCDLIVAGTRGRAGLRGLFGRSVGSEVRRNSPCPVVTVRVPPGHTTTGRGQPPWAGATPASVTESDGGHHDIGPHHPAPDGLLALRR